MQRRDRVFTRSEVLRLLGIATDPLYERVAGLEATAPPASTSPDPVTEADPTYSELVALATPTLWWMADETSGTTAADESGHNRTATIDGATVNQPALIGHAGDRSWSFDGTNDRVYRADETALDLASPFTLEAVAYPTAVTSFRTIACKKDAASTVEAWAFGINAGAFEFWWTPNGGSYYVLNGGSMVINTRYMVTVTHDGANPRLYVNGVEVDTLAQTAYPRNNALPFTVGLADGGGDAFQGRIGSVVLFEGAHDAATIAARFEAMDLVTAAALVDKGLEMPAEASSTEVGTMARTADKMVDGDAASFWMSAWEGAGSQTLTTVVTYGINYETETRPLSRLTIVPNALSYPVDFKIQYAATDVPLDDPSETGWTTIQTVVGAAAGPTPQIYDFSEVSALKIRCRCTKRSTYSATNGYGVGVNTFTPEGIQDAYVLVTGDSEEGASTTDTTPVIVGGVSYRITSGQIEQNAGAGYVLLSYTSGVLELFVLDGYLWQRTSLPGWWRLDGTGPGGVWSAQYTADPRTTPPEATPPPPVVTPTGWVPYLNLDFSSATHQAIGNTRNNVVSGSGGTWYSSNVSVSNGELLIKSDARGSNGAWQLHAYPQTYGRMETRVRMDYGGGAKACILWWPVSDNWPVDGEIDFYEPFGSSTYVQATNHWAAGNYQLYGKTFTNPTGWMDVVCEWTANRIQIWHNSVLMVDTTGPVGSYHNGGSYSGHGTPGYDIPNKPMIVSFQIDGTGTAAGSWETGRQADAPAWQYFHIDYIRLYKLA